MLSSMSDMVERLNAALEGRYAIERELGEGGMATVYLAEDIKHIRKVALKVLKPELAAVVGAERFLAEIQVTANLQHPHILPLFDSGEADSFLFYVMPYVEGETLKERIKREKQLPVDEAVGIATAVANALDHAHRHKVIHRDIKPANILIQDGEPVVSDFGIALALGAGGGDRLTETGLSLGTPYYMSPEQATGDQPVGSSTDTYALGSVLYEMLVGEPPYPGTTTQAVLGKIIAGKPVSAREHRSSVPANVDAAIRCAIEKLPADRFGSVQDFVRALGDEHFRYGELATVGADVGVGPWKRLTVAMTAFAAVATLVAGWSLLRPERPQPVSRQVLSTEGWAGLAVPFGRYAAIAPDGSSMILPVGSSEGDLQLALKMLGSTEITPIPGTEGSRDVVYSPDGEWIAYSVGGDLFKRPLVGGSPVRLSQDAPTTTGVVGLAWLDDGTILYEQFNPTESRVRRIVRISEDGGEPLEVVFGLEEEVAIVWVHGLPGARGALVVACPGTTCPAEQTQLHIVDLQDLSSEIVFEQVLRAWYAPTGHIVYVRSDGAVLVQPFDLATLELTGSAIPLFEGVRGSGPATSQLPDMVLGADGTLLYVRGPSSIASAGGPPLAPVWVERDRAVREIDPGWSVLGAINRVGLALSPDNTRLAVSTQDSEGTYDLWVKQLDAGPLSRLTFEGTQNIRATWSLDSQSLTFVSNRAGQRDLWSKRADGSGTAELVLDRQAHILEGLYSSDGIWLAFCEGGNVAADIYAIRPGVDSVAMPLEVTEFQERYIALSPNDRWLAYVSNRSGRDEVYVRPFPDAGASLQQVSADGGVEPVWAHSGRELFYRNGANEMVVVQVTDDPTLRVGQQDVLFSMADYLTSNGRPMYDVSPDDQRFVMLRIGGIADIADDDVDSETELILVQNFFEELRQRMGN